ncbi:hypothetical protein THAOC_22727, partial [Thalassiosira oceanica]
MSCHVMSCHVMSCHVMSCHVMSCHVMSCHVMAWHATGEKATRKLPFRLVRSFSPLHFLAPQRNHRPRKISFNSQQCPVTQNHTRLGPQQLTIKKVEW